jgi:DNA-binding TFAR19-related protein (PDSD5 family)
MADEELEALRKQRLAELQAKHGVSERAGGRAR